MEYTKEQKENAVKLTAIVAKKLKADKIREAKEELNSLLRLKQLESLEIFKSQ